MEIEDEVLDDVINEPELEHIDPVIEDDGEEDFIIGDVEEPTEEQKAALDADNMPHIKEFRKAFKETARRNKELEAELERLKQPITNAHIPEVLEEPTLELCGYDPDLFKETLKTWFDTQASIQAQQKQQEQAAAQAQQKWAELTNVYKTEKSKLKIKDFDDVESDFVAVIHPQKQGDILKYAKEPAKLIYALGKDPAKLKVLQEIDNPVDFVLKIKEYEEQMKTVKRSSAPPPESRLVSGTGSVVRNDAKLAQLEAEADRTGNRTALVAYRRSLNK